MIPSSDMKKLLSISTVVLSINLTIILFPYIAHSISEEGYRQLHTFAEVLRQVEEEYVEAVDEKKLLNGAIRGMLMTLDPHTIYMPPEVYKELKVEATGRFGGVGVEVAIQKSYLVVVAPVEGSPADKANIRAGDKIVKINGETTKGVNLGEAVSLMRGTVGSRITLTIVREGVQHPFDVHLVRRVIKVPSVVVEPIGDGYLYARIGTFQERTSADFKRLLRKYSSENPVKGLIIDLRNNPGGLLSQAIEVGNMFISHGVIVSTRSRDKEISKYEAVGEGTEPNYPIVLLVNGGSASASEILAGALKDYNKAILIGTQTFGKGSVQSVFEMDDGSALKITVAKYYTPSGQSIQNFGITPSVVIEEQEGDETKGTDRQKEEAIKYLKDEKLYNDTLRSVRKHHG